LDALAKLEALAVGEQMRDLVAEVKDAFINREVPEPDEDDSEGLACKDALQDLCRMFFDWQLGIVSGRQLEVAVSDAASVAGVDRLALFAPTG
jgi:hypothetical protein